MDTDFLDSHGHAIGERVPVEVAQRIVNNVRARESFFPNGRGNLLEAMKESPEDPCIAGNFPEAELTEGLSVEPVALAVAARNLHLRSESDQAA